MGNLLPIEHLCTALECDLSQIPAATAVWEDIAHGRVVYASSLLSPLKRDSFARVFVSCSLLGECSCPPIPRPHADCPTLCALVICASCFAPDAIYALTLTPSYSAPSGSAPLYPLLWTIALPGHLSAARLPYLCFGGAPAKLFPAPFRCSFAAPCSAASPVWLHGHFVCTLCSICSGKLRRVRLQHDRRRFRSGRSRCRRATADGAMVLCNTHST